MSSPESIRELLQRAAAVSYCRPALRALGESLPAEDETLHHALDNAAARRDAKAFSHLYVAALLAGRRVPASVLETGAALLPDAVLLQHTALLLDGDVAEPLAAALRSGRMGTERDAIAMIAALLDYERRDIPVPLDFLILIRRACRDCSRTGRSVVRPFLCVAAKLANDEISASILNAEIHKDPGLDRGIKEIRRQSAPSSWQSAIPNSPVAANTIGHGAPLKRAAPKAGRNDPCPCGSGRKFKQCCEGKAGVTDQYKVDGVTLAEVDAHPELLLTSERIREMRSYELYQLDPRRLMPQLVGEVAARLVLFGEIPRAIEILKPVDPGALSPMLLDEIRFNLERPRDDDALRWFLDWSDGEAELSFETEVLFARPEERMRLLQQRAREAIDAERGDAASAEVIYADLGFAALKADPALGLLIARGALPVCGSMNQSVLIEEIENARDSLGLDNNEPGYDVLDITDRASLDEQRYAAGLEKVRQETTARVNQREAEIQRLQSKIDAMQEGLARREKAAAKEGSPPQKPENPAAAPQTSPPEPSEARELREQLRRLKDNLKVEHEERNRALRDLRAAQEQLRRAPRERPEPSAENPAADPTDEVDSSPAIGEWERQPLRVPEYGKAFREALQNHPRQAATAALIAVGRLAAGDPSIWKTVRALRMRPGTLRVRIAGEYRLLFETGPANTLPVIDFILRRDLDRWLAGGGR
jgi:hypothetical protein